MKNTIIVTLLSLIFILPNSAFAKIYKCKTDGKLIYQSSPCPVKTTIKSRAFGFDGWEFGTDIRSVKSIARDRQLAMSPGTSTYISKFNEKIINSKPKQRIYTYRTKIMDKMTTVSLFFTKTTKELYKVKTVFHVIQLKPEERKYFYESLYSQLSEKYGKAKNTRRDSVKKSASQSLSGLFTSRMADTMVGRLQEWGTNTKNIVTLSFKKNYHLMSSYELTYKYMPLVNQNTKEITYDLKQRTNKAILKDSNKL